MMNSKNYPPVYDANALIARVDKLFSCDPTLWPFLASIAHQILLADYLYVSKYG